MTDSDSRIEINVETEMDRELVMNLVRDQIRSLFGSHIMRCEMCGLSWGRERHWRDDNDTRCPDCGEEKRVFVQSSI